MIHGIVAVGHIGTVVTRLEQLVSALPKRFLTPVVIVARTRELPLRELRSRLQAHSQVPVVEVQDKDPIVPGRVYLAPPDYHLLIEREGLYFALSADPPVARPSIDQFFDSAAQVYGTRAVAVMTRSEVSSIERADEVEDGTHGLAKIKRAGGLVVTEISDLLSESTPPTTSGAT